MRSYRSAFLGITAAISIFSLGGCYTQFSSSHDERDADEAYGDEASLDSSSMDDYAMAREKFYYDSYYPAVNVGISFGWGYPWYGYGTRYGYLGYYDPYFQYGGYAPWYRWRDPLLYYGDGAQGYGHGRPNTTRTIGSTRTLGGSRSTMDIGRTTTGFQPLPVGNRAGSVSGTSLGKGGSLTRPSSGVSTGRRGVEGERRGQGASPPRYVPPPPPSHDPGRTTTGSGRSSERPTYNPPPPPPQSQPTPSGGNRGSDSRGSSGSGGTREGNRR